MNYLDIEMARIRAEETRQQALREGKLRRALKEAAKYHPQPRSLHDSLIEGLRAAQARAAALFATNRPAVRRSDAGCPPETA